MINLGHGSSQIEILIWDVRNRNFDLGYPRLDLGHGHVWATTVLFGQSGIFRYFEFGHVIRMIRELFRSVCRFLYQ